MENKKEFKPYIPASKITPELTLTSIVMGIILAVVFGAANAYLGLRVGMTVSASIPAAVIAMGVIRVIMRKNSILESNVVQTVGSAGESLAAGAIPLGKRRRYGKTRYFRDYFNRSYRRFAWRILYGAFKKRAYCS